MSRLPAPRPRSLFITGASGFIGRQVIDALGLFEFEQVTCLSRRPDLLAAHLLARPGWRCIGGELADPTAYATAVSDADTVVHLAAATGNASPAELERVNVQGTSALLEECERRRVPRILFMSSIATKYPDVRHYPYGQSKLSAEALVRGSRMDFTILRPTIVLGPTSPIWAKLRQLATLPVIPVFGDGTSRVQPVAVEDVARGVTMILDRLRFAGETIELGGPETLSFTEFLLRIRSACGRGPGKVIHLPVSQVQAILGALGSVFGKLLPVSAGQLVPFVNDGTAGPSDLLDHLRPDMLPLDALLQRLARTS